MSRMATDIYFAGAIGQKPLILNVVESPDLVMRALAGAKGHPFPLHRPGGLEVYVNPATIAFWHRP